MRGRERWLWVVVLCLLPIFLALLWTTARAQGPTPGIDWSPAEQLSDTTAPRRSSWHSLAQNPINGDLMAVWMEQGGDAASEVMGRRRSSTTGLWLPALSLPAQNLSASPHADGGPVVFYDAQGDAHLLWTRRQSGTPDTPTGLTELMWRRWDGAAWSPETVLLRDETYYPGHYSFIPVHKADSVLLLLLFDRGYRMAEYKDGSWSAFSPWVYLEVMLADAVIDGAGTLHAAAFGANSSMIGYDPWFYDAYYLAYDGASWTDALNLSSTTGVAHDADLAFDRNGKLHFLWSDPNSFFSSESLKSTVWERVWDGSAWSANAEIVDDNPDQAIHSFDLTSDGTGALHLAWSEGLMVNNAHTALGIRYKTDKNNTWGPESLVYTSTLSNDYPAMAWHPLFPAVSWVTGPITDSNILFSQRSPTPPLACQTVTQVDVSGPITGVTGIEYTFTAQAGPSTATAPLSYLWEATEHPPLVSISGFTDTARFSWSGIGTQAVTVTVANCGPTVSDAQPITIKQLVYLPTIVRE